MIRPPPAELIRLGATLADGVIKVFGSLSAAQSAEIAFAFADRLARVRAGDDVFERIAAGDLPTDAEVDNAVNATFLELAERMKAHLRGETPDAEIIPFNPHKPRQTHTTGPATAPDRPGASAG